MIRIRSGTWLVALLCLGLQLAGSVSGCRAIHGAGALPGRSDRDQRVDPVVLQQKLIRFSDEYIASVAESAEQIQSGTQGMGRVEFQKWKVALSADIWTIASGENVFANLLDMIVAVTILRMNVQDFFVPKYGESAQPMLRACTGAEEQINEIGARWLSEEQQEELRQAIQEWRRQNPDPKILLFARALGFSDMLAKSDPTGRSKNPSSVFNLLRVDPLAGLEPTARELAQTRLFAERGLYIAQRIPFMLRWNAELFSYNVVELSEMQQLLTNTDELTASMDRFSQVTEQLPALLSTEREMVLEFIQENEGDILALVSETRMALEAGSRMAENVGGALTTLNPLLERLDSGEQKPDTEPFRIQDYTTAVEQANLAVQQTKEALEVLDRILTSGSLLQLSSQVAPVLKKTQSDVKEVVDYVFCKAVVFVVISCAVILITALLYRVLRARVTPV